MAKQPTPDQLDQLLKDLTVTARSSDFPEIRQMASDMLPHLKPLTEQFRDYRRRVQ
jgi:hypothetical protein